MSVVRPMHTSGTGVVVLCHQPVFSVSAWGLRFLTLKIQQFPRTLQVVWVWGSLRWSLTAFCQSQFSSFPCQLPSFIQHGYLQFFCCSFSCQWLLPGNLVFCLILVLGHLMAAKDWAEASSPYLGRDLCGRWDSPVSMRVWFRIVGTAGSGLQFQWSFFSCQKVTHSFCPVTSSAGEWRLLSLECWKPRQGLKNWMHTVSYQEACWLQDSGGW